MVAVGIGLKHMVKRTGRTGRVGALEMSRKGERQSVKSEDDRFVAND